MAGVTIYDVAHQAGVSIASVSRVLNSPESVNHATRARVLTAIDALGYMPKAEAVARARKSTQRIGVLAPFFTYPSFVQRLRGVAATLSTAAYELVIYNVDSSAHRDAYLASLPLTRRLDGIIVMALPFAESVAERLMQRLAVNEMDVVLIEWSHAMFSSIVIDDAAGGRLAAEHLLTLGRRRLGFVGDSDLPDYAIHTSDRRLAGFREALTQAGQELPADYVALGPHGLETSYRQAQRLFDLPSPPDAIFAASDTQALGALKAARDRGLRVPHDVAIIGFDDLDLADYIGLTTVRQPLEQSGRIAAELLLARLDDPTRPNQKITLPLTLVKRETA
ncbi:LacI family DNA-binding transcriptional regulator [Candidatus Amarolinea dominans]|uniref:LacI family DNA-binding transcriptional regulator n=1 Tax=Candidatus Amarolinea dominans TaxID=3140696 RepID=UPI003134D7FA|nr:LacI family DNA-binding transcriptional regulator [Anaerolineae bacterium]MBK9092281.1 LacI family DNA-binding transcriptional regulator [Anaerolineae bacterium]